MASHITVETIMGSQPTIARADVYRKFQEVTTQVYHLDHKWNNLGFSRIMGIVMAIAGIVIAATVLGLGPQVGIVQYSVGIGVGGVFAFLGLAMGIHGIVKRRSYEQEKLSKEHVTSMLIKYRAYLVSQIDRTHPLGGLIDKLPQEGVKA